ncbi:MAG: cysteine--tRNA ligase [Verrucomicrobiae bacterium]|nr:cysteine--tRNA ligase [Verrucomicrobiae bacterium]
MDSHPHYFNTLTRTVERFEPLSPERRDGTGRPVVGLYVCGPTVYDFGHLGNFRTFVFADLVRRHLEFRGFAVTHVMNITDVEDKIIRRVRETGVPLHEFTAGYEAAFLEDLDTLGCLRPHHLPRATEHLPQIIALIRKLEQRGLAYQTPDGSVYFSIAKYRGCGCVYGRLVNLNPEAQRVGERVASDEYDKAAAADFALWKARVPEDGVVFWDSPWGPGRPGWHIECSAMSMALLGPSFELHLGGEDLAFPHHEDEIAQSEGSGEQPPGRPFVKHWMHAAHLLVEGRKMSKSLGNFLTVRDLVTRGHTGREIRQLLLSAHYRGTFNFTADGLDAARIALARIDECLGKLQDLAGDVPAPGPGTASPLETAVTIALDDDLNVSRAWAAVFEWVGHTNRAMSAGALGPAGAASALAAWRRVDAVLGMGRPRTEEAPPEIRSLADERAAAKKARDFARADAIRMKLKSLGWILEDTPKGPRLKRA